MIPVYANWIKRIPRPLYAFLAQRWIDYRFPRHLFIETTATCNLVCDYCPRPKIRQDMDFTLFKEIVKESSKHGSRSFSLHLFGEPLLYPQFFEAVRFIKEARRDHQVYLTTNGTHLEKKVDEVIESGVDQVFWTWRPEAEFSEETIEKLRKWGKFRVRMIGQLAPPQAYEKWRNWKNMESRSLHNYGGMVDLVRWGLPSLIYFNRWPCYHLWLAPAISWNGDLLMCCADPHKREVFGKFPEVSIEEFWKGGRLKEIRKAHRRREFTSICATCDVWRNYPNLFYS